MIFSILSDTYLLYYSLQALVDYSKAIELAPATAIGYRWRGTTYERMDKHEEGTNNPFLYTLTLHTFARTMRPYP